MSRAPARILVNCACLVVLAFACATPAAAALYKWIDANGRVVYSDQPPPPSIKSEQLNAPPPPANPNAVKEMVQKDSELRKRQTDRADAITKSAKDKALTERRSESCTQVKLQMQQLNDAAITLYRLNEKGEREIMDDTSRAREKARLEAFNKENCPA